MSLFVKLALAMVATAVFAGSAAADLIPVKDFVRHAEFSDAKISPDGRYLAITVQRDKQDALAVLDLKDMSLLKQTVLPDEKSVGAFYWVGTRRLAFTAVRNLGSYAAPFSTGEWFAMDADGSQPRVLISYGSKDPTQRSKSVSYADQFSMLDPLPADEGRVLMSVSHAVGNDSMAQVVSMDTVTGQRKLLAEAPVKNCSIALDAGKQPRFASCSDDKGADGKYEQHVDLYRRDDNGKWSLVNRSKNGGRRLVVLGSAKDGRIYALEDDSKAPAAFGTIDQTTGAFNKLFQDAVSEPASYITASDGDTVLGVVTRAGAPQVALVDETQPDAQVYVNLAAAFPGKFVEFSSATLDGKQIVVSVSSDSQPTELYLFDRSTGKASFLIRDRQWLDGKRMATIRPFSFKARDGQLLHGYLTIPNGSDGKNLPMIVNPHGGPIGPRDDWGFNWETQLFASRGYLVLQVNFRGSGGFGNEFQEKGHREWGGKMQDDLTDATNWAVNGGLADPGRICVYGGSYGGYAALMGAIKEPALYQCAVGYVGVYDLNMMYRKGDIPERESGKRFLERTLGPDTADLKKNSPASLAGKVKIPVFLAAGLRDQRAPREQTEAMRDALIAVGHPADEVILQEGEGHGFYSEENNLNLYTKMLAFFDRYIGVGKDKVEVGQPSSAGGK